MNDTKVKGNVTESLCQAEFEKMGFVCSIPHGDCAKYDVIVDTGEKLLRIQCKTATYKDSRKDAFFVHCFSSNSHALTYYTKEDIDLFATYINNNLYVIPVEKSNKSILTLRLRKADNNNAIKNYAKNYLASVYFNTQCKFKESFQKT